MIQINHLPYAYLPCMTLFVGNLNYTASPEALQTFFGERWTVRSVSIPTDRETGRTRGFAFVDLSSSGEEEEALEQANGADFMGRPLRIDWAKPRNVSPS